MRLLILMMVLSGALVLGGGAAREPGMSLSVVTYNIRYDEPRDGDDGWAKRKSHTAQVMKDHDPDVVGLQEALRHQLDDLEKLMPGYGEIGVGRDDGKTKGEYSAILYKKDRLEVVESGTFWLSDTPEVAGSNTWGGGSIRICTWARLREKNGGGEFLMYNTHLDNRSHASRVNGAGLISKRICERAGENAAVILTGDFNAGEDDPAVEKVKDATHGPGLADSFRAVHPDETDVGTFNDFGRGPAGRSKIDYVFVSRRVKVIEAGIDRRKFEGRFPSDHFLVWARVELK